MFYEKCFRFRLLKKSNASEFASSYFLQSASASTSLISDLVANQGRERTTLNRNVSSHCLEF